MRKVGKNQKNGVLRYLRISAIAGVIAWIIGEILFDSLTKKMFTPLGIMLYFIIAFLILSFLLVILLVKKLPKPDLKLNIRSSYKFFLVIFLVFSLMTGLFEFIYELGKNEIPEPTSLIFLIDDSGSMKGNESDRVKALNEVMKKNKLPFAVYSFTNDARKLRNMEHYNETLTEHDLAFQSNGGTDIIASINDVLRDLEQGSIINAGTNPKILLVSDGASHSGGLHSMTKVCRKQKLSISSIGMEGSSEKFLKRIAEETGGIYVPCTDVSALGTDLTKAVATSTERNLLSERIVYNLNGLYAVLRILFLSVMGLVWSFMKTMLISEEKKQYRKALVISLVLCVLGALLVEIGSAIGISMVVLRLLFDVLWAVTYGTFPKKAIAEDTTANGTPAATEDPSNGNIGKMRVDIISTETPKVEGLKTLEVKNDAEPTDSGKGQFGANNQSGGLFGNGNLGNSNTGSGIFGEKNKSDGRNGLFGSNQGSGDGSGLFGK